jgi:hypothetical protein
MQLVISERHLAFVMLGYVSKLDPVVQAVPAIREIMEIQVTQVILEIMEQVEQVAQEALLEILAA